MKVNMIIAVKCKLRKRMMISEDISTQKSTTGMLQSLDLLLVEKWQEALKDCERVKRGYVKRKESFWMEGGKQEAAKKVVRVSTSTPEFLNTSTLHQQYTLAELNKMKATELLVLLSQQRTVFNKRTRKQVLINEYLGGTSNISRDN